jgi:hypothetical protein
VKKAYRYFVLGIVVMVFLAGCGKQPAEEINAAKSAVDEVVTEAGKYAPEETGKLNDGLTAAMNEVKEQDSKIFKNYSKAKEMLVKAKSDAETLKSGLTAKKEQARENALAAQNTAKAAIDEIRGLLAKAPKGKGAAADIEALKGDVKGLGDLLNDIQALIEKEDYIQAIANAITIEDQAIGVKNKISQAMDKAKGVKKVGK